ncbi:MAG: S8 family serine peptidase, partial [Mycobacteriales bacterium]
MRRRTISFAAAAAMVVTGLSLAVPAATAAPAVVPAFLPDQLLVGYESGSSTAGREAARDSVSTQSARQLVGAAADRRQVDLVQLPAGANLDAAIVRLEASPAVAYAERNWTLTTDATSNDPYFTDGRLYGMYGDRTTPANQYGSQAAEAWDRNITGSQDIYVGIIDEGFQTNHPDLDANVWTNPFDPTDGVDNDGNGFVDDTNGWDFFSDDRTVYDGPGDDHGTHVSGTIGAEGGNGLGVVGVNWDVTLISGKFLGPFGGSTADAVRAVDYMTDLKVRHGLNIVATNNSWGGGGFSQSLLDAISRGAVEDILFVAAAGNGGYNNDTNPSYPASYDTTAGAGYDGVIAVAAINKTGGLANFSQYGATSVDLGA